MVVTHDSVADDLAKATISPTSHSSSNELVRFYEGISRGRTTGPHGFGRGFRPKIPQGFPQQNQQNPQGNTETPQGISRKHENATRIVVVFVVVVAGVVAPEQKTFSLRPCDPY
jgi:hypothetical protein